MTGRRAPIALGLLAVVGLASLQWLGASLGTPPVLEPTTASHWLDRHDPITATFSALRSIGLGVGWYLIGATTLQIAVRTLRLGPVTAVVDWLTISHIRSIAAGLVGVAAAAGPTATSAAPPQVMLTRLAGPTETATLVRLPDADPTAQADDEAEIAVLERLPGDVDEPPSDETAPELRAPAEEIRVRPGDCLWHLAEERLAEELGRPPTDAEVDPYWRQVLAANDLPNPDLLFPGQVVVLPPLPGSTGTVGG